VNEDSSASKAATSEPSEVKINGERAVTGEFNEARDFGKTTYGRISGGELDVDAGHKK
jgi:hypothetical protein